MAFDTGQPKTSLEFICHPFPSPFSGLPGSPVSRIIKKAAARSVLEKGLLEQAFGVSAYPNLLERRRLAEKINTTPRSVQIWFQNRRQQEKKKGSLRVIPSSYTAVTRKVEKEVHLPKEPKTSDGMSNLFMGIVLGEFVASTDLLFKGHIEVRDYSGNTPLCTAAKFGNSVMSKMLMDFGADVDAPDSQGRSPLFLACEHKHLEVAQLLLNGDADVNGTKAQEAPLLLTCASGEVEISRALLNAGADVQAVGRDKYTPLHYAIINRHSKIVELLLDCGRSMNINAVDRFGYTPRHYACEQPAVAKLLKAYCFGNDVELNGYAAPRRTATPEGGHETLLPRS